MSTFSALADVQWIELASGAARLLPSRLNDGYIYGRDDAGRLYRSTDAARSWQQVGGAGLALSSSLLLPAGDGEIIIVGATDLYKTTGWGSGSISRASVLTSLTSANFLNWNCDSDGNGKLVATHYSTSYTESRYVWGSTNSGATWSVIKDLQADGRNDQHLHFAIIDQYEGGRVLVSHHHNNSGSGKQVEISTNFGASWSDGPYNGVIAKDGTYRVIQPTTACTIADGVIMGSDDPDTALYILRRSSGQIEVFSYGPIEQGEGTRSLSAYAEVDTANQIAYICWKQQTESGKSYIMACDGTAAAIVYEDQNQSPVSGQSGLSGLLPGYYALAFQGDEVIALSVRPSALNSGANVYWIMRAKKTVKSNAAPSGALFGVMS